MNVAPLIHVVDDDDDQRNALLRLLGAAGYDARGHASVGDFLLHELPDRPGCLVLDLRMPGQSGLDLQAVLNQRERSLPIVFLSGNADVASSVRAMKAGAVDFLTKPVESAILLKAIETALASEAAQRKVRDEALRVGALLSSLSTRERAVLDLIIAGSLNKQIADTLGIAERTVKLHRANLMSKLNVRSPAQLGQLAEQLRERSGLTRFQS
ncbi:MAG: response regulator transcription factor [Rhodocyclaceae bacterium]|nr:response regulator transcription factor [Rhodocyclaceae bacterium]